MSGRRIDINEIRGQATGIMTMWRDGLTHKQMAGILNDYAIPLPTEVNNAGAYEVGRWTEKIVRNVEKRVIEEGIDAGDLTFEQAVSQYIPIGPLSTIWPSPWDNRDKVRLVLPEVDFTDGGFNWTAEELESATKVACTLIEDRWSRTPIKKRVEAIDKDSI